MGTVNVEGKTIHLDDKIIQAGTEAIRAALSIDFDGIENADIRVVDDGSNEAPASVTVSKRAMPKGQTPPLSFAQAEIVRSLEAAPEYLNPAVRMAAEVMRAELGGDTGLFEALARGGAVARAVSECNREGNAVNDVVRRLAHARPACSLTVPVGF